MITPQIVSVLIVLIFASGILSAMVFKTHKQMIRITIWSSVSVAVLSSYFAYELIEKGPYVFFRSSFLVDHLSIFHLFLINIMFFAASVYMQDYFRNTIDAEGKGTSVFHYRRFSMLWQGFHLMLTVVILSNNIGLTWIALEATTIVSAFLIISESDSLSLEAMWKYLLVCSVGIGLAFIGTVLAAAAGQEILSSDSVLTFTSLNLHSSELNPRLMLFAFIFIAAGYGTKAGLAPMHTWLPDAHSQAPTPVSAVFSGVMLNAALFVIMRYLPVVDSSLGGRRDAHSILLLLGFLSLLFSAVFIPVQKDLKRLLAYCSVEHIGIIAIGLGLGGAGTFAALFHTMNHSVSKTAAFFSSGSIINTYGTRDMDRIRGVLKRMPFWGSVFLVSMFVLIGTAPFSVFMSEFIIIKEVFSQGRYILFSLFLFFTIAIFISILKYIFEIVFKPSAENTEKNDKSEKASVPDKIIITAFLVFLLAAGLYLPSGIMQFLETASAIIETGIKL